MRPLILGEAFGRPPWNRVSRCRPRRPGAIRVWYASTRGPGSSSPGAARRFPDIGEVTGLSEGDEEFRNERPSEAAISGSSSTPWIAMPDRPFPGDPPDGACGMGPGPPSGPRGHRMRPRSPAARTAGQIRPASRSPPGRPQIPGRPDARTSIRVLGKGCGTPLFVPIDAVIAGADPVAVIVDERIVEREEAQGTVHVQNGFQCGLQLVGRRLIEDSAQFDQSLPGLGVVLVLIS